MASLVREVKDDVDSTTKVEIVEDADDSGAAEVLEAASVEMYDETGGKVAETELVGAEDDGGGKDCESTVDEEGCGPHVCSSAFGSEGRDMYVRTPGQVHPPLPSHVGRAPDG